MQTSSISGTVSHSVRAAALAVLAGAVAAQKPAPLLDAALIVADESQRFEAVLDLDADGSADVLSWYWTDDVFFTGARVSGWLNDGQGNLVQAWSFTLPVSDAQPFALHCTAVGDLDGNALEDFAVAFGASVHVWASNGASPPTELAVVTGPEPVDCIVLGDFDGNGLSDLATADSHLVRLWTNAGASPWPLSDQFATFGTFDDVLLALDADGDGDDDIVDLFGLEVDIFALQVGELASVIGVPHGLTAGLANVLAAGDVDGDNDTDLVVFDNGAGNCSVLRNTGGVYAPGTSQPGGPATHLADVTGDGAADGVCCSSGSAPPLSTSASQFEVAVNDGTGDFAASFAISTVGSAHIAGVADMDHDGDVDLVGGRTIYYARAPLQSAPHERFDSGDALDVWGAMASMVFDADGDGDPDVRYGIPDGQVNDGAGALSLVPVTYPAAPGGKKWLGPGFPGDFDGDGDTDLVITRWQGLFSSPTFLDNWLLRNAGGGLLWTATPATAAPVNMSGVGVPIEEWDEPAASLTADVDGDGDLDLLVRTDVLGGFTTLWLNDGTGLFTQGPTWFDAVKAVAKLNGDALPDLVSAGNGQVLVRLGLGGGTFGTAIVLATAVSFKDDIAVLDLDGDADLDLVAGPQFSQLLDAWINDGSAAFTKDSAMLADFPMFSSASLPDHFAVADVNGDGQQDLIVGPALNAVTASWVLLRKTNGAGLESGGKACVRVISAADMDGDGDADVLGQDALFNDVIVDGLRFDGPTAGVRLQYGAGTAGTGGAVPVLGASGPFRVGETAALRITGLPGGKLGLITIGQAQSDLPGTPWLGSTAYNWPWVTYFFVVSPPGEPFVPGSSELVLPFVVQPALPPVGPLYHQAWFADSGAPFKRVGTNGLLIEYE
jgi:FG-GAP-like repeat